MGAAEAVAEAPVAAKDVNQTMVFSLQDLGEGHFLSITTFDSIMAFCNSGMEAQIGGIIVSRN